jgi:hypothetical protein
LFSFASSVKQIFDEVKIIVVFNWRELIQNPLAEQNELLLFQLLVAKVDDVKVLVVDVGTVKDRYYFGDVLFINVR